MEHPRSYTNRVQYKKLGIPKNGHILPYLKTGIYLCLFLGRTRDRAMPVFRPYPAISFLELVSTKLPCVAGKKEHAQVEISLRRPEGSPFFLTSLGGKEVAMEHPRSYTNRPKLRMLLRNYVRIASLLLSPLTKLEKKNWA
jgi:hypothetical protein